MSPLLPELCTRCRHLRGTVALGSDSLADAGVVFGRSKSVVACDAFPHGIPKRIASGEFEHCVPYHGDHGIQFEPS